MKIFKVSRQFSVVCNSEKTRYGFRHLASLRDDKGNQIAKAKACYYNRTWESYDFQSVLHAVIDKGFEKKEAAEIKARVDAEARGEVNKKFKSVGLLVALADVFGNTPAEKNSLKKKALGAIPGIEFPDDFDQLSDEDKQARLDGAAAVLKEKGDA